MKSAPRRSPADRDRAIGRLRAITIGTSIASVAAVGAFGALAASSYAGTSTGITTAAITSTDESTTSATTADDDSTSTSTQATAAPTATSGTAHVSTGSS